MDHDGDQVSNKPLNSKEAVQEIKNAQDQLFNSYDYSGNFRRSVGKDGTQTYYSLTRNAKHFEKPKNISTNHPLIKHLEETNDGCLDLDILYQYTSSFEKGVEPEVRVFDTVTITRQKKPIKTTVGRYIVNKIVFWSFWNNKYFDYYNVVMTGKVLDEIFKMVSQLRMEKKCSADDVNNTIDTYGEFSLRLASAFNASFTTSMMIPDETFHKKRKELLEPAFKDYREHGDMNVVEEASDKVIAFAKEYYKDDDMMEIYESGASADINNDWKTMNVAMGSLPNLDGTAEVVVEDPLSDGISMKYTAELTNTAQKGAIDRGGKTALAGAMYKNLVNGFSGVAGIRGDCGSKEGVPMVTNDKWEILNRYAIVGGKSIKITLDNVNKFLGKKFIMRSPIKCKHKDGDFCSCCLGTTPFDIVGQDKIPVGIYIAEIATGILNMFMKSTHDLHIRQFVIKDLNDFVYPAGSKLFEQKVDPIDGITKIYCLENITWRIPLSSIDAEYNYYNVLAYGSIVSTDDNKEYTMVLGTEVKTTPTEIIRPKVEEDKELEAHIIFKYNKGDVFLIQTNSYMKEMTTAKVFQLYLGGNASNLIPIDLHIKTIYNTMKTNKKVKASALSYDILIGTIVRDYDNPEKPARETGSAKYRFMSVYEIGAMGGMFNAIFSNDANKAILVNMAKSEKDQARKINPLEKALRN